MHLRARADEPIGRRRRRHRVDGGDGADRVCVDGRQQQHVVVDGDQRREGSGNGTVAFSASANPNTSPRTGTITIGSQTFNVKQAGAACTYAIAPTSQSVVAGGGTGSTAVTAPAGCAWTGVSNNTSWLTVTSGASGSGNGTVAFSASANPNTSARTGTLTIGGQTFSVKQAGAACTYALRRRANRSSRVAAPGRRR